MGKKIFIFLVAGLIITGAIVLITKGGSPAVKEIDPSNVVTKTVHMSGMTCEACEIAINKVSKNPGVVDVNASSPNQKAIVTYDKTQTDIETIMKAIEKKGFMPVGYEDESGVYNRTGDKDTVIKEHEMKCGAGKCGSGKCGGE